MSLRVLFSDYKKVLAVIALASITTLPGSGRTHPLRHAPSKAEADYVSALATANRFLYAWQSHDEEAGLLLLTEAAKKRSSEEQVADFFADSGLTTYEIGRGKKLKPGIYVFPLALYISNERENRCRPRYSQVSVVKTGKQDWGIDTLP
ncbi:MAG TPA: hypothetical protein VF011_17710 [Terriglobales bacterium]